MIWAQPYGCLMNERGDYLAELFRQRIAKRFAEDRRRIVPNPDGTVSPGSWVSREEWLRRTAEPTPETVAAFIRKRRRYGPFDSMNAKSSIWFNRTAYASLQVPGGSHLISLSDEEAEIYDDRPDWWAANYFKMTPAEYLGWVSSDGTALCGAFKGSKRCHRRVGTPSLCIHKLEARWHTTHCLTCLNPTHGVAPRKFLIYSVSIRFYSVA
jgi:hypothetical protein